MKKFWGYYDNGTYRVGCSSTSIYVYDQNNNELCRFNDAPKVYIGAFQPGTNIFVAKSLHGILLKYNLDTLLLEKKYVFTNLGLQYEGCFFSPDGTYFCDIEKPNHLCKTQLTIYNTEKLVPVTTVFADNDKIVLDFIEFSKSTNECFVFGFLRKDNNEYDHAYVAKVEDHQLKDMKNISKQEYLFLKAYKAWELSGFTKKTLEMIGANILIETTDISLKKVYDRI